MEITKGVQYVDGTNANSYLVEEADGSLTLVDAGIQSNGKKILDYITTKMMKKPSDVKTIVITHAHVDHVKGAAALKKATGAKVAIHEADADYLSGKASLPPPAGGIGVLMRLLMPFFRASPVEPDVKLKENDSVGRLKVIHTPGHTPGSIALYDEGGKVLFVGDTARYLKGKLVGPPPQFTPDMAQAMASLDRLSGLDFDIMLSGHGEPLKSSEAPRMIKDLAKGQS